MALKLIDKVIEFLQKHPNDKYTARHISEWIYNNYPDECNKKMERSNATVIPINDKESLLQQIVAEIGAHRPQIEKRNPYIKTTESRPRKYYYTELTDDAEIKQVENLSESKKSKVVESEIYPKLSQYLWSEFRIYSKRIEESKSSNKQGKNGNKWLHPDIVAVEDLSKDWEQEIKDCVQQYTDNKTKLWSFEVKILINRSNLREVFFQTVSNSSWANFGYLVASEIQGLDTKKELAILSSLHGIGLIELKMDDPSESQITIPAKEKNEVDCGI